MVYLFEDTVTGEIQGSTQDVSNVLESSGYNIVYFKGDERITILDDEKQGYFVTKDYLASKIRMNINGNEITFSLYWRGALLINLFSFDEESSPTQVAITIQRFYESKSDLIQDAELRGLILDVFEREILIKDASILEPNLLALKCLQEWKDSGRPFLQNVIQSIVADVIKEY